MAAPRLPRRVLVVDDDPSCCAALRMLLSGEGFEVDVASGGAAALALIAERVPDLLLSDVRMPGMDGLTLLREVRAHDDIPVILMSGDGKLEAEIALAGAAAYMSKPIDIDDLVRAIDEVLAQRHGSARGPLPPP